MPVDRSYVQQNSVARDQLETLMSRLTEVEMSRTLAHGGWTVAAGLAHLAFWDRYALATLARLERDGVMVPHTDSSLVNEAALPGWLALRPADVVSEVVAAARELDSRVASLSSDLAEKVLAAGRERLLDRAHHRRAHMAEIEEALAS